MSSKATAMVRIKSEVTGNVWKIVAGPGQLLAPGETLLVLESMKMEISVATPVKGTLKEMLVQEGQQVGEGLDLAIIET